MYTGPYQKVSVTTSRVISECDISGLEPGHLGVIQITFSRIMEDEIDILLCGSLQRWMILEIQENVLTGLIKWPNLQLFCMISPSCRKVDLEKPLFNILKAYCHKCTSNRHKYMWISNVFMFCEDILVSWLLCKELITWCNSSNNVHEITHKNAIKCTNVHQFKLFNHSSCKSE